MKHHFRVTLKDAATWTISRDEQPYGKLECRFSSHDGKHYTFSHIKSGHVNKVIRVHDLNPALNVLLGQGTWEMSHKTRERLL